MVISAPSTAPRERSSPGAGGAASSCSSGRPAAVTGRASCHGWTPPDGPSTGSLRSRVDTSLADSLSEFDPGLPLARARSLPSPWYRDPRVEAMERERVFGSSWQLVAEASSWSAPGTSSPPTWPASRSSSSAATTACCGPSSTSAGTARRRVMTEPRGNATQAALPLPRLDLRPGRPAARHAGVRRRRRLLPRGQRPRRRLAVRHAGGRSSGSTSATRRTPLAEFLAPLPGGDGTSASSRCTSSERREYTLACNWKVFVDNYLDGGYHVNTVHPAWPACSTTPQYRTRDRRRHQRADQPAEAGRRRDGGRQVRTGDQGAITGGSSRTSCSTSTRA